MSRFICSLIFGLILMTQIEVVYSGTSGICSQCKNFLNAQQCLIDFQSNECQWQNSSQTCQNRPNTNSSAIVYPSCASQTSGCSGQDGNNVIMQCVQDSVCHAVDSTLTCPSYVTSNQCEISLACTWNAGSSSSTGACVTAKCSDSLLKSTCFMAMITQGSAQACKWTAFANATNKTADNAGTCGVGVASDLSKQHCEQGLIDNTNFWFTYNDASSTCQYCTNTLKSNILGIMMFAPLLVLLNW